MCVSHCWSKLIFFALFEAHFAIRPTERLISAFVIGHSFMKCTSFCEGSSNVQMIIIFIMLRRRHHTRIDFLCISMQIANGHEARSVRARCYSSSYGRSSAENRSSGNNLSDMHFCTFSRLSWCAQRHVYVRAHLLICVGFASRAARSNSWLGTAQRSCQLTRVISEWPHLRAMTQCQLWSTCERCRIQLNQNHVELSGGNAIFLLCNFQSSDRRCIFCNLWASRMFIVSNTRRFSLCDLIMRWMRTQSFSSD